MANYPNVVLDIYLWPKSFLTCIILDVFEWQFHFTAKNFWKITRNTNRCKLYFFFFNAEKEEKRVEFVEPEKHVENAHQSLTRESSRRSNGRCRPTGGNWKITDSLLVAIYGANNTAQPRRAERGKRPRRRRRNNSNFCQFFFNSFFYFSKSSSAAKVADRTSTENWSGYISFWWGGGGGRGEMKTVISS